MNTDEIEILKVVNRHLQEQCPNTKIELREILHGGLAYIVMTTPIAITTIIHTSNQTINTMTGTPKPIHTKSIDLGDPNSLSELNEMIQKLHKIIAD